MANEQGRPDRNDGEGTDAMKPKETHGCGWGMLSYTEF